MPTILFLLLLYIFRQPFCYKIAIDFLVYDFLVFVFIWSFHQPFSVIIRKTHSILIYVCIYMICIHGDIQIPRETKKKRSSFRFGLIKKDINSGYKLHSIFKMSSYSIYIHKDIGYVLNGILHTVFIVYTNIKLLHIFFAFSNETLKRSSLNKIIIRQKLSFLDEWFSLCIICCTYEYSGHLCISPSNVTTRYKICPCVCGVSLARICHRASIQYKWTYTYNCCCVFTRKCKKYFIIHEIVFIGLCIDRIDINK